MESIEIYIFDSALGSSLWIVVIRVDIILPVFMDAVTQPTASTSWSMAVFPLFHIWVDTIKPALTPGYTDNRRFT